MVVRGLELARGDECRASWNWTVEWFRRAELFISELVCSESVLIEYTLGNSMMDDVLTTPCRHSLGVFDGTGEKVPNTLIAPRLFALAARSTEAVSAYSVVTNQTYDLFLFRRWRG